MAETDSTALTVADRFAIEDLYARYAWALDTGDVDGFVGCFTNDAVIIEEVFEDPDRWEGSEGVRGLAEHYKSAPGFPGRQHYIGQMLIEGGVEDCRSRSYAFVTECKGEPPYLLRFAGYYEDKLARVDGNWLFRERIIRLWDGEVLSAFPGYPGRIPRKRPPELQVKRN